MRARRRRRRARSWRSRSWSASSAREPRSSSACPGSALLGLRYEPPVSLHHRLRRARAHRAAGRLRVDRGRHRCRSHRRAFGEDDFRLATRTGSRSTTRCAPDGTFDERTGPFAGMHVREADAHIIEALRESRPAVPSGRVRALLSALLALRHAAHLLRQDELVRPHDGDEGRAARGQRVDQLVPRPHQARALRQVAREQRGLGAVARALLGHAAAGVALRRGTTSSASARSRRSPSAAASRRRTCTARTSTRWC